MMRKLHFRLAPPTGTRPQLTRGRALTWTQAVPVYARHDEGLELARLRLERGLSDRELAKRLRMVRIEASARDLVDFEWGTLVLSPEHWAILHRAVVSMGKPEEGRGVG